ncbi:uL15 family ribosomal protein [Candidatus Woesearchaeota archaeon]|nr:uL15 family ribosomal protein [Candidatus Woesearchaeota archaeon]
MTVNRRKKNTRQRGSMTHGWGAKKKHRGKGHQGGAGMAGSGKRADSKKPSIWKNERYFGKFGFVSKTPKARINAVNVSYIEQHINQFISNNLIKKEDGFYSVELEKLGFNKLLGDGKVSMKLRIKTPYASKSAIEKVREAGGDVAGMVEGKPKEPLQ